MQGVSGLGLEAQKETVYKYINSNGGNLIAEYTEIESGKNNNRLALSQGIEECKKTNSVLIVAKLDRLSRSVNFISALTDANLDFICCDFPSANKFTLHLFASIAQYERELISSRTKNALQAKKMQGFKLGRPDASFTFEMIANASKKRKEIAKNNENNRRAYTLIAVLKEKGLNYSAIANKLNEDGFKTARGCEFKAEQVKRLFLRYN